jgi:hypothetical protein
VTSPETYTLIKPFNTIVDGNGHGVITLSQSIHGLAWQIMQIGLGLGKLAPSPQIAALINGVPFVSSVVMAPSVFANFPGLTPMAMTTELTGPPYPMLEAGDAMLIGVTGAIAGDVFTAAAYVNEIHSPAEQAAIAARYGQPDVYIPRAGRQRWNR